MLRLATFLPALSAALAITPASAAQQPPIPPGPAPVMTPALEAQERAQVEQETRAQLTPGAYRDAANSTYQLRRDAYMTSLEAQRPPDTLVVPPLFETGLAMRIGVVDKRKDYVQLGPELSLAYRLGRYYVIDLPVSFMETRDTFGRWMTMGFRPSVLASVTSRDVLLYARFGPDILIPVGATDPLPNAFVGAFFGVGVGFIAARVGNGGYAAFVWGIDGSVRAAVGGPSSTLDGVRVGLEQYGGVRLGF